MRIFAYIVILSTLICVAAKAKNPIANPGFEEGTRGWKLMPAKESVEIEHTFEVTPGALAQAGTRCLSMSASIYARLRAVAAAVPVQAGQVWQVSAWAQITPTTQFQPNTPGLLLRLTPVDRLPQDASIYIGSNSQAVIGAVAARDLRLGSLPIGRWHKISQNVTIPRGVTAVRLELMTFYASGTVLWDSVSMEKL